MRLLTKLKTAAKDALNHSGAIGILTLAMVAVVVKITASSPAVSAAGNVNPYTEQQKTVAMPFAIGMTTASQTSTSNRKLITKEDMQREQAQPIEQPYMIPVTVNGNTEYFECQPGMTVAEFLDANAIVYGRSVIINMGEDEVLSADDAIVFITPVFEEYQVQEVVEHETVYKYSSLLKPGYSRTVQEGQDGLRDCVYESCILDGEVQSEELIAETVIQHPVSEIVLVGTENAPVSDLDFGVPMDENGRPLEYKAVFTNQVATGYSAREGAKTASGRNAVVGHVAVNPNEIPYGTKLYIVSSDGQFVYGYAIAADTGTGLLADIVDIDLFYDTYTESCLNGRRTVDIYILEDEE